MPSLRKVSTTPFKKSRLQNGQHAIKKVLKIYKLHAYVQCHFYAFVSKSTVKLKERANHEFPSCNLFVIKILFLNGLSICRIRSIILSTCNMNTSFLKVLILYLLCLAQDISQLRMEYVILTL